MLGKVDMARELIRYGLNPNETDNNGKTPMDLAKEMKSIVFENLDIKV
jgi:ankyrin repeat protein